MELSMYINKSSSNYGGLGGQWGATEPLTNPEDYIPKKTKALDAMAASMSVAHWRGAKPLLKKSDHIFWNAKQHPFYSEQAKITGAAKKEVVPPPVPKLKAQAAVMRDLPYVSNLPPIEVTQLSPEAQAEAGLEGFGLYAGKNKYLCVLGLLLLGLYLYNRR